MSLGEKKFIVQSIATLTFFLKETSLDRYTVLQIHHAINPEK